MKYHEPLYRPPSEADSLIFQLAYGCPHNTCLFCPMYKGIQYQEKSIDEITRDIQEMAGVYPDMRRVFLADGDAMKLSFEILERTFILLNERFPKLARISMYANGSSILSKTREQLTFLKEKKLFTLYLGLESGDEDILNKVKKQDTVTDMVEAVNFAQEAGIRMSVMILLGLGGKNFSKQHSEKTAEAVNRMSPKFLAALRFIQAPGFGMYKEYVPVSEFEAVQELTSIVEGLKLNNTVFRANHASNPIPLSARFPKDKEALLNTLKMMLRNSSLDKKGPGFIPFYL
jgi:radical SAM superfamily enzyme YgiQ (UPF0313 family)